MQAPVSAAEPHGLRVLPGVDADGCCAESCLPEAFHELARKRALAAAVDAADRDEECRTLECRAHPCLDRVDDAIEARHVPLEHRAHDAATSRWPAIAPALSDWTVATRRSATRRLQP